MYLVLRNLATTPVRWVSALLVLLVAAVPTSAQVGGSTSDSQVSVGVKVWPTAWQTWVTSPKGTGVALGTSRFQTVQAVHSSDEVSLIPFLTARFNEYFVSVSAMSRTNYTFHDAATPGGFDVSASRREYDVNGGYYMLPGLAVWLGFKQLTQTYGSDEYRWRGPIVGLIGSAPIAHGLAIYGNAAVGRMAAQFPAAQVDVSGHSSFRADYRLGEFGVGYVPPWSPSFLRSLLVTAGYRAQYVKTKNYALAVTDSAGAAMFNTSANLTDTTQGFVFGIIASF
jgi:hypothetical protein